MIGVRNSPNRTDPRTIRLRTSTRLAAAALSTVVSILFVSCPATDRLLQEVKTTVEEAHGTHAESNAEGEEDSGSEEPTAPSAPSDLTATTTSSSQIDLSWSDNAHTEEEFQIQRREGSAGSFQTVNSVAADSTGYADTGLNAETEYVYRVRATNSAGESEWTAEVSATTDPPPLEPPAAPSNLTAIAPNASQIDLSWADNSDNEEAFEIQRKEGADGFQTVDNVAANSTGYAHTGLNAETEYVYRVRATNSAGESEWTAEVSATTDPPPLEPPAAPSNLTATVQNADQIELSWTDNSDNEETFEMQRREGVAGSFSTVFTPVADSTDSVDSDLQSETVYYYRIRAINGAGSSSWSNSAYAQTSSLSTPTSVQATPVHNRRIDLSWSSPGEAGYEIERRTDSSVWTSVGTSQANENSYIDTGLVPDHSYIYRVRASDGGGDSTWSATASARTRMYAYVAHLYGLAVIDVSDPLNPGTPVYQSTYGTPTEIAVDGTNVYISDKFNGLVVIDVSDPRNPSQATYRNVTADYTLGIAVSGTNAYLALSDSGVSVIDISDPQNPGEPAYASAGKSYEVAPFGSSYLCSASWSDGLAIVDVSDPTQPGFVTFEATNGLAVGVETSGAYAYVADGSSGLYIIDLTNPTQPNPAASRNTSGYATHVHVAGSHAYLALSGSYTGVAIIDVSNPSSPGSPVYASTSSDAEGVTVYGGYAFVADHDEGLAVIDVSDPGNPGTPVYRQTSGFAFDVAVDSLQ